MRITTSFFVFLLCGVVHAGVPKPQAHLRFVDNCYAITVLPDPALATGTTSSDIVAAVYKKGVLITDTIGAVDADAGTFSLPVSDPKLLQGDASGLTVSVLRYPAVGGRSGFTVSVELEITVAIDANNPTCVPNLALELSSDPDAAPSEYVAGRFDALRTFLQNHAPTVLVESWIERGTEPRGIIFGRAFALPTILTRCFALSPLPPSGTYDLKLTFPPESPIELLPFVLKTELTRTAHDAAPLKVDDTDVGKRSVEQNLDVGVQFGSSVDTMDDGSRSRTTQGTLDLQFAPLLNILPAPQPKASSLWFLTPFFVNARVSTGSITKDTLSENRIIAGSALELRHYSNPTTYPSYQRWIVSVKNASDRDFHQAEWKGGLEFQPVLSPLNHPLRWAEQTEAPVLDPDPTREPKHIPANIGFGWQVLPVLGGEVGRTWRNHDQMAALEDRETVRRFYFGGPISLDLTRYVAVSAQDLLYVRGEAPDDRLHNYFLATANIPLPSFNAASAHSVFFSYERGGQPPFSTPDTNALKLGYRLQWDGWFSRWR